MAAAVNIDIRFTRYVGFDVGIGFFDIVLYIKGVPWRFRDRYSVVKRKTGRNGTNSNNDPPRTVSSHPTSGVAALFVGDVDERRLERHGCDEGDDGSHELT